MDSKSSVRSCMFYGIYGEEIDGVKKTVIETVTSHELTDWFDGYANQSM